MDPFSITTGVVSLVSSITALSIRINDFRQDFSDASNDVDALTRELSDLTMILRRLQESSGSLALPNNLGRDLSGVLKNCNRTVEEVQKLLEKTDSQPFKSAQWAFSGKRECFQLCRGLEAHKSTINMALTLSSMVANHLVDEKADQILSGIEYIRRNLPENDQSYTLRRFLEDTATYTESVFEGSTTTGHTVSQLELTDDAHRQLDSLSLSRGRPRIENASAPKVVRDGTSSPPSQPSEEPSVKHRFGKDQIATAGMLLKSQRPLADDATDRNLADALKSRDITARTIVFDAEHYVRHISMSPDGTLLVGALSPKHERRIQGGQSGPAIYKQEMTSYLRIWDTVTGNEVSSTSFIGFVLAISFHPDSSTLSFFCKHAELEGLLCNKITWSARVASWGVSTDLALQFELPDYQYGEVRCASFSRDCRLLAMFDPETPFGKDNNRRVHIWSIKAGHYERELSFKLRETDYFPIDYWKRRNVEISADNQLIAVSETYTVCVLSCNTGNELFRLEHSCVVQSLSFSSTENALAIFCRRKDSYSKHKYPLTGVQETSFGCISVFVDIWDGRFVRSSRSSSSQEPMLLTCNVDDSDGEGNPEIRGFRSGRVHSKLQPTRVDKYCLPTMALSWDGTKLAVAYSKEENGIDSMFIDIWEA